MLEHSLQRLYSLKSKLQRVNKEVGLFLNWSLLNSSNAAAEPPDMSRSEVLSAFDENITQDLKYQPDIQEAQLVLG